MSILLKPIGIIHSPFTDPTSMPIQPVSANSAAGRIEVFADFKDGLKDLEGFSHLVLLYHFNR